MKFDVLVLGVGGMGAAALAHLAAQGVRVIGIEQDEVPSRIGSSVDHDISLFDPSRPGAPR